MRGPHRHLLHMAPSDFLSAAVPLPGCSGYRQASLPATHRGGAEEDLPISEDNLLAVPSPLRRRAHRCPLPDPRHLPWPSPPHQRLGSLSTDDDACQASQHPPPSLTAEGARNSLRTGQLVRPASHPASRPRTGVSLPRTRTSPGARPSLAGCPQFARLSHVIWILSFFHAVPELMGTRCSSPGVTALTTFSLAKQLY